MTRPTRPMYSKFVVRKDTSPDRRFPWYVNSVALDDRFEYGSFATFAEAVAAADEWAREGAETSE